MTTQPNPDKTALHLEQELDAVKQENFRLRRELLRCKQLAQESEAALKEIESSALHRYTKALRMLEGLVRHHLRGLVLLGLLGLAALPLAPLIVLLMLFPGGRSIIWSILQKAPSALDILMLIKHTLFDAGQPSAARDEAAKPLVYARPQDGLSAETDSATNWALLQQVSPHKRHLLRHYQLSTRPLIKDTEDPVFQSLCSSETSMIKIAAQQSPLSSTRD